MDDRKKGISLILLSALFFGLMAATVKYLGDMPVVEKIFFRNLIGVVAAFYLVKKKGGSLKGNNTKLLLLRSLTGLLGIAAYFYALSKIYLADAVILNKMSPFFVVVLAAIFLNEKIKKPQFIALVLAIIGAALVIKPRFDYTVLPALIGLLSAFLAGSSYTIIRHLKDTDAPETIVFYFAMISTIAMLPFMLAGQFVMPTGPQMIGLLGLGIFATAGQLLMTNAYHFAPAGELSIYTYSNIIFSAIIGLVIWSEIPDFLSILGGGAIILAGIINYRSKDI
jgi:drug/metabolite transporter (DMT)-like permease